MRKPELQKENKDTLQFISDAVAEFKRKVEFLPNYGFKSDFMVKIKNMQQSLKELYERANFE
jgi:hypothetical protein